MSVSVDALEAVDTSVFRICSAVLDRSINAGTDIYDYVLKEDIGDIAEQMREAMHAKIGTFLEGLANGFADLECVLYMMYLAVGTDQVYSLATLQDEVRTSRQGVYAGIVQNQDVKWYIGSSYGSFGLQNRIFHNHLNPAYRSHDQYKALYKAMDAPGAVTKFILLAAYDTRVETPQVLLTESVCASLFGSFRTRVYRNLRIEGLPSVNWACGLNRSDPLAGSGRDMAQIGEDSTTYRRLRTLESALNSGPRRIFVSRRVFQFKFFEAKFTIPQKTALEWGLVHDSQVNVQWDISDGVHPHQFATTASPEEDASRVGIKVSKIGVGQGHWLRRSKESAVPLANTFYDLFTRKIVGKQYKWTPDRTYISKTRSSGNEKEKACGSAVRRLGVYMGRPRQVTRDPAGMAQVEETNPTTPDSLHSSCTARRTRLRRTISGLGATNGG